MIDTNYFAEYFTIDPVSYILKSSKDAGEIDEYLNKIDSFIFNVRNEISTAQLKKVYSEVRRLTHNDINKIKAVRIHLAYIAGRNDKSAATQKICMLLDSLIQNLTSSNLEEFKMFLEAIIAYHKYHNPKAK